MTDSDILITLTSGEVVDLCRRGLQRVNAFPDAINAVTDALLWCELHGVSSHGLNMLSTYMKRALSGGIDPQAVPRITHQHGAMGTS